MHDYTTIAAIVGADKIEALREVGVDITEKPTKPTTDVFGRWAKDPDGKDMLIISDYVKDDGGVLAAYRNERLGGGVRITVAPLSTLTFPEEATHPEDVPAGEAWLVNIDDGGDINETNIYAIKRDKHYWDTTSVGHSRETEWLNEEVTLIAPLIPTSRYI